VLTARHDDLDSNTGTLTFEVCSTNAADPWSGTCGVSYQATNSNSGIVTGNNGSITPNTSLPEGDSYWRVRSTDSATVVGAWATPRRVRVDTVSPSAPVVSTFSKAVGSVTVGWPAANDATSGVANYDVEWSADGAIYAALCTDTGSLTCQKSGLADGAKVWFRVRSTDTAGNNSAWTYYADYEVPNNVAYNLRTSAGSGILTNAVNQQATAASAVANNTTSVQYGGNGNTGWYHFRPNVSASTTHVASEPADVPVNNPTGTGWVVDAVAGKTMLPGPWSMTVQVTSSSDRTGTLQCRIYKVKRDGAGAIQSYTLVNKSTDGVDVLNGGTMTRVCNFGIYSTTSFASDEALYVELWLSVTATGNPSGQTASLSAEGTNSFVTLPAVSVAPNTPTLQSPADLSTISSTPTLQAQYTHPTPTNGSLTYQVATDTAFTNVVESGVTANVATGANPSFTVQGPLLPGVTYYWRAKASSGGVDSGWAAYRTVTVSAAPNTPTNVTPANGGSTTDTTPDLTGSAFSDPNVGNTHANSQFQIRLTSGSWLNGQDSGTIAAATAWTVPIALTLSENYTWRARYKDNLGVWSAWSTPTTFTVTAGGTTSIDATGCAGTDIALGTVLPTAKTTGTDCTVTFSASTGLSRLRVFQTDASGRAMTGPGTVLDYGESGSANWTGTSMFGACLKSSSNTTNTWTQNASCPQTTGAYWNDIPTTADQIATATIGITGSVDLNFGFKADTNQTGGSYNAPITFEVVTP
jgi:hypothetical protein